MFQKSNEGKQSLRSSCRNAFTPHKQYRYLSHTLSKILIIHKDGILFGQSESINHPSMLGKCVSKRYNIHVKTSKSKGTPTNIPTASCPNLMHFTLLIIKIVQRCLFFSCWCVLHVAGGVSVSLHSTPHNNSQNTSLNQLHDLLQGYDVVFSFCTGSICYY